MTVPLSADSTRLIGAQRFAVGLRAAMRRNKVGAARLSVAVHVSQSAIGQYRMARNVPTIEVAQRLAEALGEPRLITLCRLARTITCDRSGCGREFAVEAGTPRRYCTEECRRIVGKRRDPEMTRQRAVGAERSARVHQDAVALMCQQCEPSGICQTPECPLRMVSPIPLATRQSPDLDSIPDRRIRDVEAIRATNAKRWTPEARAELSESLRARHAAMTPDERQAFAAAVSAGRRRSAA